MFGIDFQRALFSASRKDLTFWNENAAAEYAALRAIRRVASLKQSRSYNDEDA
jgi:hypothetical protein